MVQPGCGVGKGPLSCGQPRGALKTCYKRPTLCVYLLISLSPSRLGRASFSPNQGASLVMEVFARSWGEAQRV